MTPTLFVSCYRYMARDESNSVAQAPQHPALAELKLDIGPKTELSGTFPPYTHFIELVADEACFVEISNSPSENPSHFIRADERIVYGAFEGMRISVKAAT